MVKPVSIKPIIKIKPVTAPLALKPLPNVNQTLQGPMGKGQGAFGPMAQKNVPKGSMKIQKSKKNGK